MDNLKTTHGVEIRIIKNSLALLKNQQIKDNLEDLKTQYKIIIEALIRLQEMDLTEPTRKEVTQELNKLKIDDALSIIETTIVCFGKPLHGIHPDSWL